jgi:non-specific protein-tyrosine kinase
MAPAPAPAPVEQEYEPDEPEERQEVRIVRRLVQLPDGRQAEQKVRKVRKIKKRKLSASRRPLPAVVDLPDRVEIVRISHKTDKEMIPAILGDDPAAVRHYHVMWNKLVSIAEANSVRLMIVTSSLPQEGKTITSINLAATIAQEPGVRVLLIDADLRQPKVDKVLGIDKELGLAQVLEGKCPFGKAFYHYELERFYVMPAGEIPLDPIALLTGPKMEAMLDQARACSIT